MGLERLQSERREVVPSFPLSPLLRLLAGPVACWFDRPGFSSALIPIILLVRKKRLTARNFHQETTTRHAYHSCEHGRATICVNTAPGDSARFRQLMTLTIQKMISDQ
jgi:hypothetical protein